MRANLIVPEEYTGEMMELCAEHRGEQLSLAFLEGGARRVHMVYRLPLAEVVTDFFDKLKSRSSGFASFDYEEDGWESSDLVKVSQRSEPTQRCSPFSAPPPGVDSGSFWLTNYVVDSALFPDRRCASRCARADPAPLESSSPSACMDQTTTRGRSTSTI